MKRITKLSAFLTTLILVAVMMSGSLQNVTAAEGAQSPNFTDISSHWARSYIERIAEKGIVQGKSRNRYAPDDNISRAELLKIALNAFELEVDSEVTEDVLSDVKVGDWFAPYVKAAFKNDIIYGFNDGFKPNTPVTRGMAATILVKAAGYKDVDSHFSNNYSGSVDVFVNFPDVPVGAYFAPFISYLYDMQIIDGYEDGTFGPDKLMTRAEVAKVVVNMLGEASSTEEHEPDGTVTEPEPATPESESLSEGNELIVDKCGSFSEGVLHDDETVTNQYLCYDEFGEKCMMYLQEWNEENEITLLKIYDEKGYLIGGGTGDPYGFSKECVPITEEFFTKVREGEVVLGSGDEEEGEPIDVENHPATLNCEDFPLGTTVDRYVGDEKGYFVCYTDFWGCLLKEEGLSTSGEAVGGLNYKLDGEFSSLSMGESKPEECLPTTKAFFDSIVK